MDTLFRVFTGGKQFVRLLERPEFILKRGKLLPYKDDNPTRSFPIVNWLIIAGNLWVFLPGNFLTQVNRRLIFRVLDLFLRPFRNDATIHSGTGWEWFTVFSSMFSHGGVAHLLGNMLFLYLYGDNLRMRWVRFATWFSTWVVDSLPP